MSSVVHVVTTPRFAGVERYVCDIAAETKRRGWSVAVVGGDAMRMPEQLGPGVRWLPGPTAGSAALSLVHLGRFDVCHAHMTTAETLGVALRPFHRALVVSTRHFAGRRGASRGGRIVAPMVSSRLAYEIAVSEFVAERLQRRPDLVSRPGVRPSGLLWDVSSRVVLVMQRLEREKATRVALEAWKLSGLADRGWVLRVVGSGSEKHALEEFARAQELPAISFADWTASPGEELARAGMLIAPAPAEPFGLAVVEAMAAGVPVVAAAGGGHLETVGRASGGRLFPPGNAEAAAEALRSLSDDDDRRAASAGVLSAAAPFTVARHVDDLLQSYDRLLGCRRGTATSAARSWAA
jgi:glycosyltransferase involved in cell wall biosynthesis